MTVVELPSTLAEYEARFKENVRTQRREGEQHLCLPCPFCAAPDWLVVQIEEFRHSTSPIYCEECQRSARFVSSEGGQRMELVQVAGPDAPEWLPKVRHENPRVVTRSAGHLDAK